MDHTKHWQRVSQRISNQLPDYDPATLAKKHLEHVENEITSFKREYWDYQAGLQIVSVRIG